MMPECRRMKHLMTQENEWDVVMGGKVGMEMCVCVGGVSGGGADAVTSFWLLYTQGMEPTVLHIPAAETA